jgi:mevalonate kinase
MMGNSITLPGKVFLIGEYAVLFGLPAILTTIGPRFSLNFGENSSPDPSRFPVMKFHPQSPSGILRDKIINDTTPENAALLKNAYFEDSFLGEGGFGASTAQYALLYRKFLGESINHAYALFRKMHELRKFPPSGADLIAQWLGGTVYFRVTGPETFEAHTIQNENASYILQNTLAFQATHQKERKTSTHSHLKAATEVLDSFTIEEHEEASRLIQDAMQALRLGDLTLWGKTLNHYAEFLNRKNLEAPESTADRIELSKEPGVRGVKGAGARLSDLILVVCEPGAREVVIEAAEKRNLRWLKNPLGLERGIQ